MVMPVTFVAVVPLPALVIALPAFVIPMVAAVAIAVKVDIRDVDAAVAGNHNDVIAAPLKVLHVHTIQVGNLPPAHRAAMAGDFIHGPAGTLGNAIGQGNIAKA